MTAGKASDPLLNRAGSSFFAMLADLSEGDERGGVAEARVGGPDGVGERLEGKRIGCGGRFGHHIQS